MMEVPKNIEIVHAKEEHVDNIKSTLKDFYLDEPIFKAQKIDVEKLDESFYTYKKTDYTILAIDKCNGAVASLAINSITKPDNVLRQRKNAS